MTITHPTPTTAPRLELSTLLEAFDITAVREPDRAALNDFEGTETISWGEYAVRARRLAASLAALGIGPGDTVALMLANRPEFHLLDAAVMRRGAIPFSIYATSAPEQIAYMLEHSRAGLLVSEQRFAPAIQSAFGLLATAPELIVIDGGRSRGGLDLAGLEAFGRGDDAIEDVRPDSVATLIYTSGTTGPPKAVELTHRNLLSTMRAVNAVDPLPQEARIVSYLPAAHIAERFNSHYLPMVTGGSVTTVSDARRVFDAVAAVHPTAFFGVPRIWEKLRAAIESSLDRATMHAVERSKAARRRGEAVPATEFAPLRRTLGLDELRFAHVAAAPTPQETIEFFHAIGVPLSELWGLSESCAVSTLNPPGAIRIGTVGRALPCVELRLADDGEILLRGTSVMRGYRDDPARTAEALDGDGWLRTGDIGEVDQDGYVRIVDRKKELIINAAGKNMSPANIEGQLRGAGSLIAHAVAIGDRRPYNVALLTLEPDSLAALRRIAGLPPGASAADVARDPVVLASVDEQVQAANAKLSRVEQIKRYRVFGDDWPAGGPELTPTSKLKREAIAKRYAAEIEELYR